MEIFRLILRDHNFLICPTAMVRRETYLNLNTRWTSEKFKSLRCLVGHMERAPIGVIAHLQPSLEARFLNKNAACNRGLSFKAGIAGGHARGDLAWLVFQDNVLRGFNSIISGDLTSAAAFESNEKMQRSIRPHVDQNVLKDLVRILPGKKLYTYL